MNLIPTPNPYRNTQHVLKHSQEKQCRVSVLGKTSITQTLSQSTGQTILMGISRGSIHICVCQVFHPHEHPCDYGTKDRSLLNRTKVLLGSSLHRHRDIISSRWGAYSVTGTCQHVSNAIREKLDHMPVKHRYCNIFQKDNCLQYKISPAIR